MPDSRRTPRWDESIWRRGWNDASRWFKERWWFVDGVPSVLLTVLAILTTGEVFYGPPAGLASFLGIIFLAWMFATARAPLVQRNEARHRLQQLTNTDLPILVRRSDKGFHAEWPLSDGKWLLIFPLDFTNQSKRSMSLQVDLYANLPGWVALSGTMALDEWKQFKVHHVRMDGDPWETIDNRLHGLFDLPSEASATKTVVCCLRRLQSYAPEYRGLPWELRLVIRVGVSGRSHSVDSWGFPVQDYGSFSQNPQG